jgi:hypothetical protein
MVAKERRGNGMTIEAFHTVRINEYSARLLAFGCWRFFQIANASQFAKLVFASSQKPAALH